MASISSGDDRQNQSGAPTASDQTRTISVLVIDDDVAVVRMVRLNLISQGVEVATAENGHQGLERVAEIRPDVIILDLQMPGMSGRDVFRELRARGNATPVIIFSAFEPEEARRELGAEAALEKPFNPDRLLSMVQQLADKS